MQKSSEKLQSNKSQAIITPSLELSHFGCFEIEAYFFVSNYQSNSLRMAQKPRKREINFVSFKNIEQNVTVVVMHAMMTVDCNRMNTIVLWAKFSSVKTARAPSGYWFLASIRQVWAPWRTSAHHRRSTLAISTQMLCFQSTLLSTGMNRMTWPYPNVITSILRPVQLNDAEVKWWFLVHKIYGKLRLIDQLVLEANLEFEHSKQPWPICFICLFFFVRVSVLFSFSS